MSSQAQEGAGARGAVGRMRSGTHRIGWWCFAAAAAVQLPRFRLSFSHFLISVSGKDIQVTAADARNRNLHRSVQNPENKIKYNEIKPREGKISTLGE